MTCSCKNENNAKAILLTIPQPLNVSVFSSFKSFVLKKVHKLARTKHVVDVFDIANLLTITLQASHIIKHICNGVEKSENWN